MLHGIKWYYVALNDIYYMALYIHYVVYTHKQQMPPIPSFVPRSNYSVSDYEIDIPKKQLMYTWYSMDRDSIDSDTVSRINWEHRTKICKVTTNVIFM